MMNQINLSRIDLNLLALFEVVLEERHVGRAAGRMNLTASAVSHGLGRLRRLLNDPLFLKTPKGVTPTARATALAAPVADILARVRNVVAAAEPFDPARSVRRFTIGAPDGALAVFLAPLLAKLGETAPGIDISARQLLPEAKARAAGPAWEAALDRLESGDIDIAVIPTGAVPARFVRRPVYEERFVIASRAKHPFAREPTLDRFCEMRHLLVSLTGDAHGFVDDLLAKEGRSRHIALTVPNFMMALSVVAETDLIAALPSRLVAMHAARYGLTSSELPLPMTSDPICAVASKAAMMDAGVAWLFGVLQGAGEVKRAVGRKRR
jgi:DNA-binding transcriptional LysR family regulator